MEIAIVLCIAVGISCAAIASAKHRSVFGWLVIGTLVPIVGLILVLALPAAAPSVAFADNLVPRVPSPPAPPAFQADEDARAHLQRTTFAAMQRLGSLKDEGVITSREFDEKKAELLARL